MKKSIAIVMLISSIGLIIIQSLAFFQVPLINFYNAESFIFGYIIFYVMLSISWLLLIVQTIANIQKVSILQKISCIFMTFLAILMIFVGDISIGVESLFLYLFGISTVFSLVLSLYLLSRSMVVSNR